MNIHPPKLPWNLKEGPLETSWKARLLKLMGHCNSKVAHNSLKIAHNYKQLVFQVLSSS